LNDDASKIEMLDAAILEVDVEGVYSLPVSVRAPENLEGARLVFGITLGGEWLGGENIDVADRSQFVASRRGDIALSPKMGLSRVEIDSSGKLTVFGWVLAAEKIDEIIVALDGSVVDRAEYPSPRPDVYQIYPEYGTTRSGFRFETQVVSEIPPASLPLVQVSARSAGNLVIESERVASRPPERLDP
jgi:hypothetical protein